MGASNPFISDDLKQKSRKSSRVSGWDYNFFSMYSQAKYGETNDINFIDDEKTTIASDMNSQGRVSFGTNFLTRNNSELELTQFDQMNHLKSKVMLQNADKSNKKMLRGNIYNFKYAFYEQFSHIFNVKS